MKPLLILQTRRLGDLVLTFPLLVDLSRRFPGQPLWVVAEPEFSQALSPFCPDAVFFGPGHLPVLAKGAYEAIFNFASGQAEALCAGQAGANARFGLLARNGRMEIEGFWQLYRASLTRNNRHNAFHWADLNRMDLPGAFTAIRGPAPQGANSGRVGLFIGASEPSKRPDALFWGALAQRLRHLGFTPLLLGGPAEKVLGEEIARMRGLPHFCGKTDLAQLGALFKSLDLLITPDTGPMHLADWLGVPLLNISLGNVQALETGPLSPGQWVARAAISCKGCWQCSRPGQPCRKAFNPRAIAALAAAIIRGEALPPAPRLELARAGRHADGLYRLEPLREPVSCGPLLDNFWREAFLAFARNEAPPRARAEELAARFPALAASMRASLAAMLARIHAEARSGSALGENFWREWPRHSRIFAGHVQMSLQNQGFSPAARSAALERSAGLVELFAGLS